MRVSCWVAVLILVCCCVSWGAEPEAAKSLTPLEQGEADFEQNVALGPALTMRAGLPGEMERLSQLFAGGLKAARDAVAGQPEAAEAHYLLGSWILYGYRVVEVQGIAIDAEGGTYTQTVAGVVQGSTDSAEEGLESLRRATELAPGNGRYLLDYTVALADYERPTEAILILRAIWAGQPELTPENKMEAGLVLSDIYAAEGRLAEGREWVYDALSVKPENAGAVQRLRLLDSAQAAEAAAQAEAAAEQSAEAAAQAEVAAEQAAEAAAQVEGLEYEQSGEGAGEGESSGVENQEDW